MTASEFQKKLHRDRRDSVDRNDPDKIIESLKAQGVSFVKTQMRTLVFDYSEQRERILRASPEIATVFICLIRDHDGNAIP